MGKSKKSSGFRRRKQRMVGPEQAIRADRIMSANVKAAAAILCLITVAMATDNMMSVPVPPNFQNPWILRLSLGLYKVYTRMHDVVEYVWDANVRFLCFKSTFVSPPPPPEVWTIDIKTRDTLFHGVPVRVYEPSPPRPDRPGIVFFHGGGWFIGSVHMYDSFCRSLADATGAVVVSVEYRLAPDHWYPTPLNDCEAAARYFLTHAHTFGVNPSRIAIVGDSAGGNLAASVNLKLRDKQFSPKPSLQVLVYPALQALDLRTPSYQKNARDPILSQRFMAGSWFLYAEGKVGNIEAMINNNHTSPEVKRALYTSYLNHNDLPQKYIHTDYTPNSLDHGDDFLSEALKDKITDPYFSPLVAKNLSGLPETYIMTMEHDVLRDDGILYAQRLLDAGNNVTHLHYESGFHGLISYPIPLVQDCKIATKKLYDFLRENL